MILQPRADELLEHRLAHQVGRQQPLGQNEVVELLLVPRANGYPSSGYRAVIRELKKKQITGDAILSFFNNRLHEIEKIITAHNPVTLPSRPAIMRLATPAETAQQPAPHMTPPPFLHNTGQRGGAGDQYDDFTFDAVASTLTAHEARPGHELQFDSMVEHGAPSPSAALVAEAAENHRP